MSATGTATINFGAAPGTNVVSVAVTGQTEILAGAFCEAYFQADDSTATHNAYEHMLAPLGIALSCGTVVAGTGFTINAISDLRLDGTFSVRWVWSNP